MSAGGRRRCRMVLLEVLRAQLSAASFRRVAYYHFCAAAGWPVLCRIYQWVALSDAQREGGERGGGSAGGATGHEPTSSSADIPVQQRGRLRSGGEPSDGTVTGCRCYRVPLPGS